jgi:hypothetical protein
MVVHSVSKAVLCVRNSDAGHMSEVLNSMDRDVVYNLLPMFWRSLLPSSLG